MSHELLTSAGINARNASRAWLNAFLASGDDDARPALYRTLSVEFFTLGVQFVGCDGTMLFRTWVPEDGLADMPLVEEAPDRAVVVMDVQKFAKAFMTTLGAAMSGEGHDFDEITLTVEPVEAEEPTLSEELRPLRLTLRALGQELHCALFDGPYPNWRQLQFGMDRAELVDGMTLATRLFATVGKLKGVSAVACDFLGAKRQIVFHATGEGEVRGLLMPMRRLKNSGAPTTANDQIDTDD